MLAVLGALFANGLIAILKFIAAVITGSSGMMAEALHSVSKPLAKAKAASLKSYRKT